MDEQEFEVFYVEHGGKIIEKKKTNYFHRQYKVYQYFSPSEITKEAYLKITEGPKPRIGAIGRLIGFADSRYGGKPEITIEFDGRPKPYTAYYYEFEQLPKRYDGGTKWVWNKGKPKPKIDPFVNKFGQELEVGSLITGIEKRNKKLRFGYVTRYTESNIWIKPIIFSCDGKYEPKEIWIDNAKETCMFEEDFLEHLLALKLMS